MERMTLNVPELEELSGLGKSTLNRLIFSLTTPKGYHENPVPAIANSGVLGAYRPDLIAETQKTPEPAFEQVEISSARLKGARLLQKPAPIAHFSDVSTLDQWVE